MRVSRFPIIFAVIPAFLACSNSTEPLPADSLLGQWHTEPVQLNPAGSHQYHLTFSARGTFAAEVRTYGLYPKQRPDELSAYVRTSGTFTFADDQLSFKPASTVTWDRFYGADSPSIVQTPSPYQSIYDDARYRVDGGILTLDYITYPADAPVPTRKVFRRN